MSAGHAYGTEPPTVPCPYCRGICEADSVDIGVGMQHLNTLVTALASAQGDLSPPEAGALQYFVDTLETLSARGLMVTKPYTAQLAVKTPGGYAATLTIERTDGKEFFAALAGMEAWLQGNHYGPLP